MCSAAGTVSPSSSIVTARESDLFNSRIAPACLAMSKHSRFLPADEKKHEASNRPGSVVHKDTVTISAKALAFSRESGPSRNGTVSLENVREDRSLKTAGDASQVEDAGTACRPGIIIIGGEQIDVMEKLQAIAEEDFGKFIAIMGKLKSDDPAQMPDGLAQILDVPKSAVRSALEDMGVDVTTFVQELLKQIA